MKHLLILILLTACGGAEFSSADSTGAAGNDSSAGTAGVTVTGGSDAGGTQGQPGGAAGVGVGGSSGHGGAAVAGSGSQASGGTGGGSPAACEFDPEAMMAALPTEIDLGDFTYTSGELCVTCRDKPCRKLAVISWGVPTYDEMYGWLIRPNVEVPMVALNIGTNDGSCTVEKECGTKPDVPQVVLTVKQQGSAWVVDTARFLMHFNSNGCTDDYADSGFLSDMTTAVDANVSGSLNGLEIPCGK